MNAIVKAEQTALQLSEGELIDVLATSLYPGVSVNSIKMVLGYCKATGLDPLQKPVHPVPMWDAKSGTMRDVVMPGIGLYRIQASRSGQHIGTSEPEFGPDVTEEIGGQKITYPKWCKVVVSRRLHTGEVAEYAAKEFWRENYATKGGKDKSIAPNAMWSKRPYGQIAKCAESQALRRAFPECDKGPTAEEMEGKAFNDSHHEATGLVESTAPTASPALIAQANKAASGGAASYQKFWGDTGKDNRKLLAGEHERLKAEAAAVDKARTVEQPAAQAADTGEVTADQVLAKINAATNEDALLISGDWINAITDNEAVKALNKRFDERLAELRG
jgi:phage recombination protein Bet